MPALLPGCRGKRAVVVVSTQHRPAPKAGQQHVKQHPAAGNTAASVWRGLCPSSAHLHCSCAAISTGVQRWWLSWAMSLAMQDGMQSERWFRNAVCCACRAARCPMLGTAAFTVHPQSSASRPLARLHTLSFFSFGLLVKITPVMTSADSGLISSGIQTQVLVTWPPSAQLITLQVQLHMRMASFGCSQRNCAFLTRAPRSNLVLNQLSTLLLSYLEHIWRGRTPSISWFIIISANYHSCPHYSCWKPFPEIP